MLFYDDERYGRTECFEGETALETAFFAYHETDRAEGPLRVIVYNPLASEGGITLAEAWECLKDLPGDLMVSGNGEGHLSCWWEDDSPANG